MSSDLAEWLRHLDETARRYGSPERGVMLDVQDCLRLVALVRCGQRCADSIAGFIQSGTSGGVIKAADEMHEALAAYERAVAPRGEDADG